jgi:hypothetical protein
MLVRVTNINCTLTQALVSNGTAAAMAMDATRAMMAERSGTRDVVIVDA